MKLPDFLRKYGKVRENEQNVEFRCPGEFFSFSVNSGSYCCQYIYYYQGCYLVSFIVSITGSYFTKVIS